MKMKVVTVLFSKILVEMKNILTASYESILTKLDDLTFSQLGFNKFVTNVMLESYSYNCFSLCMPYLWTSLDYLFGLYY